ncbi:MAG: sulfite exporter TauE/SafE family protein [Candidatus Altiarchaeota archaeon]|nr:sulfite exporter TauE/SafE family protein [Candidatus Altiarchaeota archaeon]
MDLISFMESMGTSNIPLVTAFFIGLMTAISPCPLTTNITAVAYISRKIDNSKNTILVGLFYTLGRIISYTLLAGIIVYVGVNSREVAMILQEYGEIILGPLLLIAGLVMIEAVKIKVPSGGTRFGSLKQKLGEKGYLGGFLLGMIFALSFCPFSAVLYFGMLIPLAVKTNDALVIPSVFAFATGLPVIISSVLLVKSVSTLGKLMHKTQAMEKTIRKTVAVVFILVGLYFIALTIT